MFETEDAAYFFIVLGIWANVEIALCIISGCLFVLPRFFQTLKPQLSYFFRSCYLMQRQRLGVSGFSTRRRKAHRSTCTVRGPYEHQDGNHSNHTEIESSTRNGEDGNRTRSLAIGSKHSRTGNEDVEGGLKENQILKTVVIETVRDCRPSSDLNVEDQLRDLGW